VAWRPPGPTTPASGQVTVSSSQTSQTFTVQTYLGDGTGDLNFAANVTDDSVAHSGPAALEMVGSTATSTSTAKVTGLIEPARPVPREHHLAGRNVERLHALLRRHARRVGPQRDVTGVGSRRRLARVCRTFPGWHSDGTERRRATHCGRRRQCPERRRAVLRQLQQHALGLGRSNSPACCEFNTIPSRSSRARRSPASPPAPD